MATQSTHWELVSQILDDLPLEGALTKADVEIWARWHQSLVNELELSGWFYRGMSVKYQGWSTLLVVKAAREGTPYVVFVTERDTTSCMRVFLNMWDQNRVAWKEDKFG